jgi:DNA-binding Lrp family transcriptional regulator
VDGKVIATLEDYAIARQLLAPIFDAINAEGLTPAVRATVEAIRNGEEVSQSELCHRLGLAKPTVSYRVNRALRGGWLTNNETRVNAPARLVRGAPLPDQTCALPSSEIVRDAFERSNQFAGHTDHPSCTEHVGEVDRFEEGML